MKGDKTNNQVKIDDHESMSGEQDGANPRKKRDKCKKSILMIETP
jgi:hypothetical protein